MTDKKQLNEENLEDVSGGLSSWTVDSKNGLRLNRTSVVDETNRYSIVGKDVVIYGNMSREMSLVHVDSFYEDERVPGKLTVFKCTTRKGAEVSEFSFNFFMVYTEYMEF